MIRGINHITLVVRDLTRSIPFYVDLLGARLTARWDRGAYLDLGGIWLCLEVGDSVPLSNDTHIAFDCSAADFPDLSARIAAGADIWKENRSEGASLYFLDPDGYKLEIHVGDMNSRLADPKMGQHRVDG